MDLGIHGRTALVTGASAGIGRAVVKQLAREGVVVVAAARRVKLMEAIANEVAAEESPGSVVPAHYDLADDGAGETLAARAADMVGPIDILMNTVGASRRLPLDAPRDSWDEAMLINFWAAQRLTHALVGPMMVRGWGRVINFTGSSEPRALSGAAPAKAATQAWSKGLASDIAASGVTVNCIQPGMTRTEQLARIFPPGSEEESEEVKRMVPMGRMGLASETANVAVFLASEAASFVTGAVIPVDGGLRRFAF